MKGSKLRTTMATYPIASSPPFSSSPSLVVNRLSSQPQVLRTFITPYLSTLTYSLVWALLPVSLSPYPSPTTLH
jgi:hypothetical protein